MLLGLGERLSSPVEIAGRYATIDDPNAATSSGAAINGISNRPKLPASPSFFANPKGNGSLRGRYGPRALHNLVLEAGTSAGVAGRHHPHRWRHTYATSLVRRGEDIHVVQRLMGHSNIATTTRYLRLSDADLLEAIDRAFPES